MKEIKKWFAEKGDDTLRVNYPLTENSIVIDLGGFKGEWAEKIYGLYKCNIHILEPVTQFYNNIFNKYIGNTSIKLYHFGLGKTNEKKTISVNGDASSIFKQSGTSEEITIKDAKEFLKDFQTIDLMKINIEGAEFDLLEYLIETQEINKITDVQVQFHAFIDNAEQRRKAIQEKLSATHVQTYNYDFIWENWKKKEA